MKITLTILLIGLVLDQTIVEKLNAYKRELKYCSEENKLTDWTIDDAVKYNVTFEKAELIDKKLKLYDLRGKVTEWNGNPLEGITIKCGEVKKDICQMQAIGQTDGKGNFHITTSLSNGMLIGFSEVGFKSIIIKLDLEK
jgi:hypothetical protein